MRTPRIIVEPREMTVPSQCDAVGWEGMIGSDEWTHPYTREQAAWPAPWLRQNKFWTHVARVDNPYGDRNLACSCEGMDQYDGSS